MKYLFIVIPIFLITILSCQKIDDTIYEDDTNTVIHNVYAPARGKINKDVEFILKFYVANGCGRFNKFIEHKKDNTITIGIEAKYVGEACTQATEEITVVYKFKTDKSGTYNFRFKSDKDEYSIKTVNVF